MCDAVAVFPEGVSEALPGWGDEQAEWTASVMPGNVREGGWWLHFHSYLVTGDSGVVLVDAGIGAPRRWGWGWWGGCLGCWRGLGFGLMRWTRWC